MGAVFTTEEYRGALDAENAYARLRRRAELMYGRQPYEGNITSTNGVSVMTEELMSITEAKTWAREHMESVHKWEEAGAIPLKTPRGARRVGWLFFFWAAD